MQFHLVWRTIRIVLLEMKKKLSNDNTDSWECSDVDINTITKAKLWAFGRGWEQDPWEINAQGRMHATLSRGCVLLTNR